MRRLALESFDRPGAKPNEVSVPVVRILADGLGTPRSELLYLAGYHGDAFDRVDEMGGGEGEGEQRISIVPTMNMSTLEESIRDLIIALDRLKQQAAPPDLPADPVHHDAAPGADPPSRPSGRGKGAGPAKRKGAAKK